MISKLGLFCVFLTTALASPVDYELVGIQCRCLSLSIKTTPSACTILGFQNYNWLTAQSLASEHSLELEFASQTTISKVLSIDHPLSTSVLQAISHGEADLSPRKGKETENKMICGYDDEVRNMSRHGRAEPESHGLGQIVFVFMLLLLGYIAGEYFWIKYREGKIKLAGEEQALTLTSEKAPPSPPTIHPSYAATDEKKTPIIGLCKTP